MHKYLQIFWRTRLGLESIQNEKIKGQMIRSRMQWLTEAEKPTSYFCKLENTNFVNKTTKKLKLTNDSIITDQKQILKEVENFYSQLFCKKKVCVSELYLVQNSLIDKIKKIPNLHLGRALDVPELGVILKKMK